MQGTEQLPNLYLYTGTDNILLLHNITWKITQNIAMMALDLSAAFDTINHKILLHVLNKYFGIQETALNG